MLNDSGDPPKATLKLSQERSLEERISPDEVQLVYETYHRELFAFLIGVLNDPSAAQDVSQVVFRRLIELGHTAQRETIKGWLFTVAMNEALDYRRKVVRQRQHLEEYCKQIENSQGPTVDEVLVSEEEASRLRELITQLPKDQQQVVRLRIHTGKTFAVIATELQVPLNTVLTRMRLALDKLRKGMHNEFGSGNE